MTRGRLILSALLLTVVAAPAAAQFAPHRYQIGARLGTMRYDKSSGIDNGPLLGVDGTYFLNANIGIGFMLDVAKPQTKGEFFPAELTFGDTTFLYLVSQPLTVVQVGAQVVGRIPMGNIAPYVALGAGWYRFFLDPQVSNGPKSFTHPMLNFAAGLNIRLGESSGLRFEVRDFVHTDFDRSRLNPVGVRFQPTRFPDTIIPPEAPKTRTNNIQLALAFSFIPGGQ